MLMGVVAALDRMEVVIQAVEEGVVAELVVPVELEVTLILLTVLVVVQDLEVDMLVDTELVPKVLEDGLLEEVVLVLAHLVEMQFKGGDFKTIFQAMGVMG
jgi:hypothetical protein